MKKKYFKITIATLAGITLGSTCVNTGVTLANTKPIVSINHSYSTNMNKVLLEAGLTKEEIKQATFEEKNIIYKALIERSEKGEFTKKLIKALRHVKGHLKDTIKKIGIPSLVAEAIKLWNDYDGTPSRVIYHTLRHFGVSKHNASRWTHIIMDIIGFIA